MVPAQHPSEEHLSKALIQTLFEGYGPVLGIMFTKVPAKNYGFVYFEGPKKEKHAARAQILSIYYF